MTELDDMFEEVASAQARQADADDNNADLQARLAAKRTAEIAREIRQGVRDADGFLIVSDDEDETDEDDA